MKPIQLPEKSFVVSYLFQHRSLKRIEFCLTIRLVAPGADLVGRHRLGSASQRTAAKWGRAQTTFASNKASKMEWYIFGISDSLEVGSMLWTIFVILLVLWLLGLVSSYTLGGYILILLVIALVVLVIQLVTGRRPVV